MKTSSEIRRENLLIAIGRAGSATKLAEKAAVSAVYLSQIKNRTRESKTGNPKTMGDDVARKIEAALGEKRGWMDTDHSAIDHLEPLQDTYTGIERRADPEALHFNAGPELDIRPGRFVAIVGTGQGGSDGFFSIDDHPQGQGDGAISSNSPDPAAYAIRVRGDSMRPRIKSGEFIIAEPSMQARPGDDVVVRLKDGRAMVKEWQWEREGEISLGSVNDAHPPITIQLHLVKSIHRVAAIVPRGSAILKSRED